MTSTKMPMSKSRKQLRVWTLIGALLALAVMTWLLVPSGDQQGSEPNPSTTSDPACSGSGDECFQTVTVLKPTISSAQSAAACKGADVTAVLNSSMTSETMQINALTFNRNAERIVVDVPADIEITTIIVGGVAADVQGSTPGLYKTTFLLPKYSWGGDSVVTVCLA